MCVISAILFEICRNTGWVHESSSYVWRDTKMFQSITLVWPCHPSQTTHNWEASLPLKLLMNQKLNLSCPWFQNKKQGFLSKGSLQLLEDQRLTAKKTGGCYASGENLSEPLQSNAYTIFQSVLHVITFSNLKTTYNSLKVVLTEPNVTNGVQIPN